MDRRTTSLPSSRKTRRQQMNPFKSASFSQEMLQELEEKNVPDGDRIKQLETEVNRVKESENKMLESLVSQTKKLEETKIELEEAKLEIKSLLETIRDMGNPMRTKSLNLEKNSDEGNAIDPILAQEEITRLKNELRLATGAEEMSKQAMDDLAAALREVASEANQAKEKLLVAQTELLETRAEVETRNYSLKNTEEKLRKAMDDVRMLKRDADESLTAWNTKQEGFRDCMRLFEEEITKRKKENNRLIEAQRVAKDEISKMRDIMKQALNEANVVKEALEIARNENSHLQDTIAEKDRALERIGCEHESLKASEAASTTTVIELKNMIDATSNPDAESKRLPSEVSRGEEPRRSSWDEIQDNRHRLSSSDKPKHIRPAESFSSEVSKDENFRHNVGSSSLRFPPRHDDSPRGHKGRSLSDISGSITPIVVDDDGWNSNISSYYFDSGSSRDLSHVRQRSPATPAHKKKPVFKKFTDMIKRKSFSVK